MNLPEFEYPDPELRIDFNPPIGHAGMTCDHITLREPTGAEVRSAEGHLRKGITAEAIRQYQLSLIQKVSGVHQAIVDNMPISKVTLAAEYLQAFVNPSPLTGNS